MFCFVVHVSYFMSILILQFWWGRESWLLRLVCLPGVSWLLFGSSWRYHGFSAVCDCGISWSYSLFLIVLTKIFLVQFTVIIYTCILIRSASTCHSSFFTVSLVDWVLPCTWYLSSTDNLCKHIKMSGLIWIKTVWHSDSSMNSFHLFWD